MKRIKLAVIFGGASSEYEISLLSVTSVLEAIDTQIYEVITIGITRQGEWYLYNGDIERIAQDTWSHQSRYLRKAFISPNPATKGIVVLEPDFTYGLIEIDVVLPVLHGQNGEDGTIQGLLEISGLPYVGCNTLSSAICMDKSVAHCVLENAGIRTVDWVTLHQGESGDFYKAEKLVEEKLSYPVFVKPANTGSSVGVSKAKNRHELKTAIEKARQYDRKVVVERCIEGTELECAVLGNQVPVISGVGEICPTAEFYDYDAKYNDESTELFVTARISEKDREAIRATAAKAYRVMGCSGLARIDFFLEKDGSIILNELNTMPGFTSISMYAKLFEAQGVPYSDLLDKLIGFAIERKVYNG